MIGQKVKFLFQISQPTNIPQNWFSTQNGPFDVRFQIRLTLTKGAFYFLEKLNRNIGATF